MSYKYIKQPENYEDYSSGRVLYGYSEATNFPVRLSKEIFERCDNYLRNHNNPGPYNLYDPFCGVAYTLTVLGIMYTNKIKSIFASDINQESLKFAEKNISLLNNEGLNYRMQEIESYIKSYDKKSHKEALLSALRIRDMIKTRITTKVFKKDSLSEGDFPVLPKVDIIICDIPYGILTQWGNTDLKENPVQKFLNNIKKILSDKSIVVISSDKKQEILYEGYQKIESFKIGKRKILFLTPSVVA